MREIWRFQPKLEQPRQKQVLELLHHRRFRAAYDFLLLRCETEEKLTKMANWWTELQNADNFTQEQLIASLSPRSKKSKSVSKEKSTKASNSL